MPKLKIGIIGAGYMGDVHAALLTRDRRVHIAAVHDVTQEKAQRLANSFGAQAAQSTQEVIERCDAVYITTPNTRHAELAIAAAQAGKHIFCEKPMATSVAEARAVLEAAEKSDAVFQVGHNRRFAPVYTTLKRLLTEKSRLPHSAHVKMNRGELLQPEWVGDPQITGGFLYETTIHMFDLMRFLFGEITKLQALGSSHEYPETDDFSVLLQFAGGMHATFASSADASWLFPFERVEVFGHHSTITTREMESLVYNEALDGRDIQQSMHQLAKEEKWGYLQEDQSFIDSITRDLPPAVTAEDGSKAVELVDSCYRSVSTGEAVKF
jgi:myo-inositol 2-dehydrogenase/D-chiro-inositol 1-dehydrogenase